MKMVGKTLLVLLICIAFLSTPTYQLTGSSCDRLYIYSTSSNHIFSDTIPLQVICADSYIGKCWLTFNGDHFIPPIETSIFSNEDVLQIDVSKFPTGSYTGRLMNISSKTVFSNNFKFNIHSNAPVLPITTPSTPNRIDRSDFTPAKYIPVLGYHNVGYGLDEWSITPAEFEDHIQYLSSNGYHFCTPQEIYLFTQKKKSLPEKSVFLTFDDGCKGVYQYALPILEKYNVQATLFVINSYVGMDGYITWEELDSIVESGLFTLGSHTYNMHGWIDYSMIKGGGLTPRMFHLYEETFDEYLERVRSDLQQSIQELEDRYHTKIDCFAYPFGAYDKDTLNRVKESGFKLAFTFHREEQFVYPHSNPYTLDRIPVLRNTKLFQLIPSP